MLLRLVNLVIVTPISRCFVLICKDSSDNFLNLGLNSVREHNKPLKSVFSYLVLNQSHLNVWKIWNLVGLLCALTYSVALVVQTQYNIV